MRVLLLDNYDSFTFNLAQYFQELGAEVDVVLNDRIGVDEVEAGDHAAIVLSPGPGRPDSAGISLELIRRLAGRKPILGVCLGHQAIAQVYGGQIVEAPSLMHGKTSPVSHDGTGVFTGLPSPFTATRYHSLVVEDIPDCLHVNATSDDDHVQGFRHKELPIHGVQFHPESIATEHGHALLATFLNICGVPAQLPERLRA